MSCPQTHAGKHIVITYACRAFGLYLAEWFLARGAFVFLADPNRNYIEQAKQKHAKEHPSYAGRVHYQHCDHTSEASIRSLCQSAHETLKVIDVVIFYVPIGDGSRPASTCDTEHYNQIMHSTCGAQFHFHKYFTPIFQSQHKTRGPSKSAGQFINCVSNAGVKGGYGGAACTQAHHAMIGQSDNTAFNHGHENIHSTAAVVGKITIEVIEEVVIKTPKEIDIFISVYSEASVVKEDAVANHLGSLCEGENAHLHSGSTHYLTGNHPSC